MKGQISMYLEHLPECQRAWHSVRGGAISPLIFMSHSQKI